MVLVQVELINVDAGVVVACGWWRLQHMYIAQDRHWSYAMCDAWPITGTRRGLRDTYVHGTLVCPRDTYIISTHLVEPIRWGRAHHLNGRPVVGLSDLHPCHTFDSQRT